MSVEETTTVSPRFFWAKTSLPTPLERWSDPMPHKRLNDDCNWDLGVLKVPKTASLLSERIWAPPPRETSYTHGTYKLPMYKGKWSSKHPWWCSMLIFQGVVNSFMIKKPSLLVFHFFFEGANINTISMRSHVLFHQILKNLHSLPEFLNVNPKKNRHRWTNDQARKNCPVSCLHLRKLTWNLKMMVFHRNLLF